MNYGIFKGISGIFNPKLNVNLVKEHDKIEKHNVDLKYYIEFIKNNNETLIYEMTNLRNQASKCETCVSMKKEVKVLHEILSKIIKGKEKLYFII